MTETGDRRRARKTWHDGARKLTLGSARGRERLRRSLLGWYDQHRAIFPGGKLAIPTGCGSAKSCCSRRAWRPCSTTTGVFLERFPTVEALAAASEEPVLAAWSGLGYYRRARMLHRCAQQIVSIGGHVSAERRTCSDCPASDATRRRPRQHRLGEPVAVVDGNVERVLQRLQGHSLTAPGNLAAGARVAGSQSRPGDFNQAMMELGATVCLPRRPLCLVCPVFRSCATQGDGEKRRPKPRQKSERLHYALDGRKGSVFLIERPAEASLMPGMWELPEISNPDDPASVWLTLRHSITTTDYLVRVRQARACPQTKGRWVLKRRAGRCRSPDWRGRFCAQRDLRNKRNIIFPVRASGGVPSLE